MRSLTTFCRALAAGSASLAAVVLVAGPAAAAPPLSVSPLIATSNDTHGDTFDVSGASCDPPNTGQITIYLYEGAFGPEETPSGQAVSANGAVADGNGDWSGALDVPGGSGSHLTPGQYTVRAGCYPPGASTIEGVDFWYENVVVTITTDETGNDTTTTAPATTTTAQAAANNAVNANPAFTG